MHFVARFTKHEQQLFRLDTRIYLRDRVSPNENDPCVAAIIAKNPGSATPTKLDQLTELALYGDKLLPTVKKRFVDAYSEAGVDIPANAFIRVWNLLYLCNPNLTDAINAFESVPNPMWCDTEQQIPQIVWFAWGPPKAKLDLYKQRFLSQDYRHAFFFDMDSQPVVAECPNETSRVKHTQGMPRNPIHDHIVNLIAG